MRKLVFAALAALSLGAAAAQPAQAACRHIPGGWRCVHHRVVIVHHPRRYYHHYY
jgi:hypothetical protein